MPLFLTTRWSLVNGAAAQADESLEVLCRLYWQPVYAVARRAGNDVENAKDLTQGFFAMLLGKRSLGLADRGKGRFRTFLVTALKRYMIDEWRREHAAKRGGFVETVPLDADLAEIVGADDGELAPDALFDRRWALALLDAALHRLELETGDFDALKECLTADRGEIDYAAMSRRLSATEGATRVAVHRLRKRYRQLIREEVARTVADEAEVDQEMRVLMEALM
ncbi:sigma factor [Haloferula sp. BvORR071]|uniref:RNA polymerase sigma factor n=1 Tax=Haloferula sp. BvORR071 TaxID=1396141 RepID=UPI000946739F|nr:sigma factor [Haloferula sp. BvORR071]